MFGYIKKKLLTWLFSVLPYSFLESVIYLIIYDTSPYFSKRGKGILIRYLLSESTEKCINNKVLTRVRNRDLLEHNSFSEWFDLFSDRPPVLKKLRLSVSYYFNFLSSFELNPDYRVYEASFGRRQDLSEDIYRYGISNILDYYYLAFFASLGNAGSIQDLDRAILSVNLAMHEYTIGNFLALYDTKQKLQSAVVSFLSQAKKIPEPPKRYFYNNHNARNERGPRGPNGTSDWWGPRGAQGGDDSNWRQSDSTLTKSFQTLGIDSNTSESDIKKAYRRLASVYHPDKPRGSHSKMQDINTAYDYIRKVKGF